MKNRAKSVILSALLLAAPSLFAMEEILEPSGIDQIEQIINEDEAINKVVSAEDIAKAQEAASQMNSYIKEAVYKLGLANDDELTRADVIEINRYLVQNHADVWEGLLADYKLVQPKLQGRDRRLPRVIALNKKAIDLWAQLYKLGLKNGGAKNAKDIRRFFNNVGYLLSEVMRRDLLELHNPNYQEIKGTTGTSLDQVIQIILTDPGLQRKVTTSDLRVAAKNADRMNRLIVEAIKHEGLANDGRISTADVRTINHYLVQNYKDEWKTLHGDDENEEETGFHRVQNDGASTRMFARNFINTVADGIYHLGFATRFKNNLENEDGNKNARFEQVAWWLNTILQPDLQAGGLKNNNYHEIQGSTGTALDTFIPIIFNDKSLERKISMEDIREGAKSADAMNHLIVEAIKETGVATDNYLSVADIKEINNYLVTNYAQEWTTLHGDDEGNEETGFHKVQGDGATTRLYGANAINTVLDGIYHLGFATRFKNNLENEDGNKNASFKNVAYWLNRTFHSDYSAIYR